jgi:hypothetical protein
LLDPFRAPSLLTTAAQCSRLPTLASDKQHAHYDTQLSTQRAHEPTFGPNKIVPRRGLPRRLFKHSRASILGSKRRLHTYQRSATLWLSLILSSPETIDFSLHTALSDIEHRTRTSHYHRVRQIVAIIDFRYQIIGLPNQQVTHPFAYSTRTLPRDNSSVDLRAPVNKAYTISRSSGLSYLCVADCR